MIGKKILALKVTREDLQNSVISPCNCPIAQAANRVFGKRCTVGGSLDVWSKGQYEGVKEQSYNVPSEVYTKIFFRKHTWLGRLLGGFTLVLAQK